MSSPSKAAANAANAQHSSGPKTVEGKARSSRNAVTHGFTAQRLSLPPDQQEQYDELREALRQELTPEGLMEILAFDQLVREAWKLQSIQAMEDRLLSEGLKSVQEEETAKTLDRLNRYQAAAGRAWYRALKELRALQTERTLRGTIRDEIAALIPTLASLAAVTRQQAGNGRAAAQSLKQEFDAIMNMPEPHPGLVDRISAELEALDKEEEVA
jgi:hypothetical protein